jgi:hypothetical protein
VASKWLLGAVAGAAVVFGILLDRHLLPGHVQKTVPSSGSATVTQKAEAPPQPLVTVVEGQPLDPETLRNAVNGAVRRALDERAAEDKAAAESGQQLPTAHDIEATQKANLILDRAIAARRWTVDDRRAFDESLRGVNRDRRREVERRMIGSINSGELSYTPRQ